MKLETDKQEFLARYLLGQLSESESARLEDSSFSNQEQLEELRTVENDLIDEYVRGELPADQKASFERLFLANPQRRKRIEFAVALDRVSSNAHVTNSVHQRLGALTWRDSLASIFAGTALRAHLRQRCGHGDHSYWRLVVVDEKRTEPAGCST